jgi:hypothetical protein
VGRFFPSFSGIAFEWVKRRLNLCKILFPGSCHPELSPLIQKLCFFALADLQEPTEPQP